MTTKFGKTVRKFGLITCVLFILGCSNTRTRHIGEWKSSSENMELILDKNNDAILIQNNQAVGGKDWIVHGGKGQLKYIIDYSKKPIWLDLIGTYKKKDQTYNLRLNGIIRFITGRKMEYRIDLVPNEDTHPKDFDTGRTFVLEKQN